MTTSYFKLIISVLLLIITGTMASEKFNYQGSPKFAYGFSSHMVLQRDTKTNVYGLANPGTAVTISIASQKIDTKANEHGRWLVQLEPMKAGGSYVLKLDSEGTTIKLEDVMLGDVWICAGQSNMRYNLARKQRYPKKEDGSYDNIQGQKDAPQVFADELVSLRKQKRFPIRHAMGGRSNLEWIEVNYENASNENNYSPGVTAVGYFFAKHLRKRLGDVPIGIIQAGNGGAPIRSFLPKDLQWADSGMKEMNDKYWPTFIEKYGEQKINSYYQQMHDWLNSRQYGTAPPAKYMGRIPGHNFYHHFGPLKKLCFKGMLYYQGESDAGRGYYYYHLLNTFVDTLREHFEFYEMPFLTIMLPPAMKLDYMDVTESQLLLADYKKGAHAVYAPEGAYTHPSDLHPPYKEIVGKRAAMTALNEVYGVEKPYLGPRYESHRFIDDSLIITFRNTHGGLILKEGETVLTGFQIAGIDKKFVDVQAKLGAKQNTVVIAIPPELQAYQKTLEIRFQKMNYYVPVLYGKSGLPAVFFRTDKFETRSSVRAPKEWNREKYLKK